MPRKRQLSRPGDVDDRGAALTRNCGTFCLRLVHLAEEEHEDGYQIAGGNTHAWVRVFVPGPAGSILIVSWLGGNQNLIRVAVVEHPRDAIPLQGTWYGSAVGSPRNAGRSEGSSDIEVGTSRRSCP